jgi:hypothetical protein
MELHKILFLTFIILQVLDIWSTVSVITRGKGSEANKIMAFMILKLGTFWGLTIPKIAVVALIWYILDIMPLWCLSGMCLLYLIVIRNNIKVLNKYTG